MAWGFFKKKERKQLPQLEEDTEDTPPLLENMPILQSTQRPKITVDFHDPRYHSRQNPREAPIDFTPGKNTITLEGITYSLADVELDGEPTMNFVVGAQIDDFIYSYKIERLVLPLGVVYFSEDFHRDALQKYRVQCMIHMILRDLDTANAFSKNKDAISKSMWLQQRESFFIRLYLKLQGLGSKLSGAELRMYQSVERLPARDVSEWLRKNKIEPEY